MARIGTVFHEDDEDDDQETGMWCWLCGDEDHNPRPSCVND
ncbi:hypothetical protein ACFYTC_48570 [Actinomadura nitritigenes]|jgi:hypothetical protein